MITEDYVSKETAKLLKEKGFSEWCSHCYGVDVRHKGESIDFDEECELKDEGRGDEIEYVDGGLFYDYGCANKNEDPVYAAPTLHTAIKWLEEVHRIVLVPDYDYECTDTSYCYKVYRLGENGKPERVPVIGVSYDNDGNEHKEVVGYRDYERSYSDYATREMALDDGIRYCLEKYL